LKTFNANYSFFDKSLSFLNISNLFFYWKGEKNVSAAAKPLTLQDRILQIDHIQARRFSKLNGITLEIASEGIIRHLRACARMDVNPDASAVREIIDDALNGRRVFAETSNDLLAAA
jgi:hypothetical protein